MKKTAFLFITTLVFGFILTSMTSDSGCDSFYKMEKGMTWKYNNYDKKGKLEGITTNEIEDVINNGGKTEIKVKGTIENANPKKGEEPYTNSISYTCEEGVLKMDMQSMIPEEQRKSMESMELEFSQSELLIPNTLVPGQSLADASVTMIAKMNGMTVMNMTVNITERKVEKAESITTDAGTFNCVLLTYKTTMKMGFSTITSSSKDWLSAEVGMIKSESYDKNGNLTGSTVLTSFTK